MNFVPVGFFYTRALTQSVKIFWFASSGVQSPPICCQIHAICAGAAGKENGPFFTSYSTTTIWRLDLS